MDVKNTTLFSQLFHWIPESIHDKHMISNISSSPSPFLFLGTLSAPLLIKSSWKTELADSPAKGSQFTISWESVHSLSTLWFQKPILLESMMRQTWREFVWLDVGSHPATGLPSTLPRYSIKCHVVCKQRLLGDNVVCRRWNCSHNLATLLIVTIN